MGTTFRKAFFRPWLKNICICIFFLVAAALLTHMSFGHCLLCLEHSPATVWSLSFFNSQLTILYPEKPFLVIHPKEGSLSPHFLSLSTLLFSFICVIKNCVTHLIGLLIQYLLPGCKLYGGQKPYLLCIPSRCLAHRCPKGIC